MKAALVIERMDVLRGGREVYTAQLAEALAGRGHEVTILCQNRSWQPDCQGVRFVELGRRGTLRRTRASNFVADVQTRIATGEFDVVHAMLPVPGAQIYHPHGGTIPGSMEGALRRRGATRPISRFFKRFNGCRRDAARRERIIAADGATLCVCVSELIARQFEQYYNLTDRVRVVFNGVSVPQADAEQRADWRQRLRYTLGVSQDEPVFLIIATNFELKGVSEAIVAFARHLNSRGGPRRGRLVVVGRDRPESYERFAGMRDIAKYVVFLPPTRATFQWYSAADVFLLLTWYDPCSLTVLEATRWGVPSITTAFNGASEVLVGGAGVVIDQPRSFDAIVAAMNDLSDPLHRQGCVEACEKVAPRLTMDRHVDELLKVYAEAAGRK